MVKIDAQSLLGVIINKRGWVNIDFKIINNERSM